MSLNDLCTNQKDHDYFKNVIHCFNLFFNSVLKEYLLCTDADDFEIPKIKNPYSCAQRYLCVCNISCQTFYVLLRITQRKVLSWMNIFEHYCSSKQIRQITYC